MAYNRDFAVQLAFGSLHQNCCAVKSSALNYTAQQLYPHANIIHNCYKSIHANRRRLPAEKQTDLKKKWQQKKNTLKSY